MIRYINDKRNLNLVNKNNVANVLLLSIKDSRDIIVPNHVDINVSVDLFSYKFKCAHDIICAISAENMNYKFEDMDTFVNASEMKIDYDDTINIRKKIKLVSSVNIKNKLSDIDEKYINFAVVYIEKNGSFYPISTTQFEPQLINSDILCFTFNVGL